MEHRFDEKVEEPMARQYSFWNNGANVRVESLARNLEIRRAKYATEIIRKEFSPETLDSKSDYNWFHLQIPTPTHLFRYIIKRNKAFLRGVVSEGATIKKVYIHHKKAFSDNILYKAETLNLTAKKLDETFDLPHEDCTNPLVLSVLVQFEPKGRVIFTGTGASFEELG